jgi:hypothetical protein
MVTSKVFWTGAASGALLIGSALGAAWYASAKPECVLSRAFDGACHASRQLSPVSGLGPVLARLQHSSSLAKNETDVSGGNLPDEPMPDDGPVTQPEPAEPGSSVQSNVGDPAPIVIPDSAPPAMPEVDDEEDVEPCLPLPREVEDGAEEEQEPRMSFADMLRGILFRFLMPSPDFGEEPFPEAPMPPKAEEAVDPHHGQCPAAGGCPRNRLGASSEQESPARKAARKLLSRETMDGAPVQGVETLELREADRLLYEYGPGAL